MNQELLDTLKKNIDNLIHNGKISNAKLFLFGMNTPGDRVIQYLKRQGYNVSGILDNNSNNHGKLMMGIKVYKPEILQQIKSENIRVLICSKYYTEMKMQLEKIGFTEERHIFKLLELNSGTKVSDDIKSLENEISKLRKYTNCYEELTNKYSKTAIFLLCPIRANGDVYMTASLVEEFKRENDLEEVVLVVVGKSGQKIAAMFHVLDVEVISQKQMEGMVGLVRVLGSNITRMIVVHPEQLYYNIFSNMECFKGLNFIDLMAHGALGLKVKAFGQLKEVDRQENRLGSRDILLAPYANSLPCFKAEFWEQLVLALTNKNYHVYTNSNGDMEPPVKGTTAIFLPIEGMRKAIEHSAGFVSIRNGLCDIVSKAECKKIILYPDKGMGFADVREFYSLNGMELCNDAKEIIYSEEMEKRVIELIVGCLSDVY